MRQFDVYRNPSPNSIARAPLLLVLPNKHFLDLPVTLVAPLIAPPLMRPMTRLNPVFVVGESEYVLSVLELANIRVSQLKTHVANLEAERDRIVAALDFLFTGV